jgi:hypothetical protein
MGQTFVDREQERSLWRQCYPCNVLAVLEGKREGLVAVQKSSAHRNADHTTMRNELDKVEAGHPVTDGRKQRIAIGSEGEVSATVDGANQVGELIICQLSAMARESAS